uniref:Uncharacterized protein n=1 Tax=Rhipicephalus zambeziensis TaxID=60191 RepID=A0A224YLE3_9ACAR
MLGYVGSIIKRTLTSVRDSMPVNKDARVLMAYVRTKAILESCSVQELAVFRKKVLAIQDANEASIVICQQDTTVSFLQLSKDSTMAKQHMQMWS